MDSFVQSISLLSKARRLFDKGEFLLADQFIRDYQQTINYDHVPFQDGRVKRNISISIIISSKGMDDRLIDCIESLAGQSDSDFEIIIMDHSGSENKKKNWEWNILRICLPQNFSLSEGRNIGAYFSAGDYLVFIDVNSLIHPDFMKNLKKAWSLFDFAALEGKIVPKLISSDSWNIFSGDKDYPVPLSLLAQGHIVIKKQVFKKVGKFDPLFSSGALIEWGYRCQKQFPGMIYYWPTLIVAEDAALERKIPNKLQGAEKALDDLRRGESKKKEQIQGSDELYHAWIRAQRLELQLNEIRSSLPFRLGSAIREAAISPFKKSSDLFEILATLVKNLLNRGKISTQGEMESGVSLRNQKKYLQPGIEEHNFTYFKRYRSLKSSNDKGLRIACILGVHLHNCLEFEAQLIPLCPYRWKEQLDEEQPDMIMVQSSWAFYSKEWKNLFSGDKDLLMTLKNILDYCKKRKLPTVFWDTEYRDHFSIFSKTACLFDIVLSTDPKSSERYRALLDSQRSFHQPLVIQPALHNPVLPTGLFSSNREFSILFDGWADILEWPDRYQFLKDLFSDGLHIAESRYRFVANKLDDLPEFRKHVMGYLPYPKLLSALRFYRIYLISEDSLSSPLSLAISAMEAAACGSTVIYKGGTNEFIPDGIVTYAVSDLEIIKLCRHYLEKEADASLLGLKTRRKLFGRHSYAHMLKNLCSKLGLDYDWEEYPKVTMITPSKRPELFFKALQNFKQQRYPNKEWIVLLNSSQNATEKMKEICQADPDIKMFQLNEEKNIGTCLNFGIKKATGEYWFKIDDDDFYGPNYILDMMMEIRGVDADIFGKPPGFVFFEKEDALLLRNRGINSQYLLGRYTVPDICGATISGKKRKGSQIEFSEEMRACVDTNYLLLCKSAGLKIYLSSVWGFSAVRRKNKHRHTWRTDYTALKKNSICFGNKSDIKKIMG